MTSPTGDADPRPSTAAGELSSLRSQLDDLARRVTALAEAYKATPDSQVASDLFAAERALMGAMRSLDRAAGNLTP